MARHEVRVSGSMCRRSQLVLYVLQRRFHWRSRRRLRLSVLHSSKRGLFEICWIDICLDYIPCEGEPGVAGHGAFLQEINVYLY